MIYFLYKPFINWVYKGDSFSSISTNQFFSGVEFCYVIRNIQFFGFESQQKVSASYVVVIGLGGVGNHAASIQTSIFFFEYLKLKITKAYANKIPSLCCSDLILWIACFYFLYFKCEPIYDCYSLF
ncbi:hypothetical protein HN51_045888 [Arachis hypogaea]